MVDDILSIQTCSEKAVQINAVINAFIESKKLTLSESKCKKIHISKQKGNETNCPVLKVHDKKMNSTDKDNYLGDIVHSSGQIRHTIEQRRDRGYAIVAEIIAILDDIPLGKYKIDIGLKLREAMLLNRILFNSEAWHNISDKEIKILESVDEHLLRSLVKGQSKTPLEFLYLEAGAMPIRFIISSRRMIYLHSILRRVDDELIKKIYKAQRDDPTPGDWCELLNDDFNIIGEELDEAAIANASTESYTKYIKSKVRGAALKYLNERKETHSKIRHIEYVKLEKQTYLSSPLFTNEDVYLLFSLRSRSVDCKENFKSRYKESDTLCPLCRKESDSQTHMIKCDILSNSFQSTDICEDSIDYDDLFEDNFFVQGAHHNEEENFGRRPAAISAGPLHSTRGAEE